MEPGSLSRRARRHLPGERVRRLDVFAEFCRRRRFEGVAELRIESA
jgi:hypothetical protein